MAKLLMLFLVLLGQTLLFAGSQFLKKADFQEFLGTSEVKLDEISNGDVDQLVKDITSDFPDFS